MMPMGILQESWKEMRRIWGAGHFGRPAAAHVQPECNQKVDVGSFLKMTTHMNASDAKNDKRAATVVFASSRAFRFDKLLGAEACVSARMGFSPTRKEGGEGQSSRWMGAVRLSSSGGLPTRHCTCYGEHRERDRGLH